MPKVSAEHKEQVRQRLLDAARCVVVRDGPEAVTTRAILAEADLSAGSLYNYFASKEELFEALVEQVADETVTLLAAGPGAMSANLADFVTSLMTTPDEPALAWFRGRMSSDPDVRRAQDKLNRHLVEVFTPTLRAAQAEGVVRDDLDPEAATELVDILWDGMNRRSALGTFVTGFERVGETFLALLRGGAFTEGNLR
ncbi:MAG: TetR/AcrR family transcriptional regulator [Acidimicrobiales bacterium]